jgi:hypothetical protein
VVYYCVRQHECSTIDKAIVDSGAIGGICGEDMLVVKGSKCFVDVSGLAGNHKNMYCDGSGCHQHT